MYIIMMIYIRLQAVLVLHYSRSCGHCTAASHALLTAASHVAHTGSCETATTETSQSSGTEAAATDEEMADMPNESNTNYESAGRNTNEYNTFDESIAADEIKSNVCRNSPEVRFARIDVSANTLPWNLNFASLPFFIFYPAYKCVNITAKIVPEKLLSICALNFRILAGIERELASRADQRVLRWFGHVERMDVHRMARKVLMAEVI